MAAADEQLAKTANAVEALYTRAVAVSALALINRSHRIDDAVAAITRARTVTTAAGVLAEQEQLVEVLAAHDPDGLLAPVHAALRGD